MGLSQRKKKEGISMSINILIDHGDGMKVLAISNDIEYLKSLIRDTLDKYGVEYDPPEIDNGDWEQYDFDIVEYIPTLKDDVIQIPTSRSIRKKIEGSIDEIERVLIGNKSRDVEEVYLNNAIRDLKELICEIS